MIRSALYMPGANERALEKAKSIPADALILDLEDAVAPDAKPAARERVCALVADRAYGERTVAIRVNAPGTPWHEADLQAALEAGPSAVLVPKVESPQTVRDIPGETPIWAMLETPTAVLCSAQIAAADERLTMLVLGTNDLANELHAESVPGRAPLLTGIGLALLGARAAGKLILDGVYNDVKDAAGFEAECLQGRQFGFDGKTLIHPSQVEPCNRVFSPSAEQIAESQEILAAWEEATADGRGVATVRGRLVENLHVENAKRILARAKA
ncbi:HpcH/HpaI aldolase/citrate lyase family protein [Kineosporia babensis]|uniref:CoA ester lyase n=1 Tax=Kineosporia babensis TaxID=499548 RepID=A0A9X1NI76_9ACTN|nr:CoA ester lyase [Kineosporia babensis]MCD5315512.1 CoA ester lyase [Kineosporia babensis]